MSETETMVERVAKALFEADQSRPFTRGANRILYGRDTITWEEASSALFVRPEEYYQEARAAIAAMHEPTEAILRAGVEEPIYRLPEITALKGFAKQRLKMVHRYRAMMAAALTEEKPDAPAPIDV